MKRLLLVVAMLLAQLSVAPRIGAAEPRSMRLRETVSALTAVDASDHETLARVACEVRVSQHSHVALARGRGRSTRNALHGSGGRQSHLYRFMRAKADEHTAVAINPGRFTPLGLPDTRAP